MLTTLLRLPEISWLSVHNTHLNYMTVIRMSHPPAYIALDISRSCTLDQTLTLFQMKLS